jgi:hypothetical protein
MQHAVRPPVPAANRHARQAGLPTHLLDVLPLIFLLLLAVLLDALGRRKANLASCLARGAARATGSGGAGAAGGSAVLLQNRLDAALQVGWGGTRESNQCAFDCPQGLRCCSKLPSEAAPTPAPTQNTTTGCPSPHPSPTLAARLAMHSRKAYRMSHSSSPSRGACGAAAASTRWRTTSARAAGSARTKKATPC